MQNEEMKKDGPEFFVSLALHHKAWQLVYENTCSDCGRPVSVTIDFGGPESFQTTITGGAVFFSHEEWQRFTPIGYKCDGCHKEKPAFGGNVEVYSRVVGYLRPVRNWNNGKQAEFGMRSTFDKSAFQRQNCCG